MAIPVGSDVDAGGGIALLIAGGGRVMCWWIAAERWGGLMALTDSCETCVAIAGVGVL